MTTPQQLVLALVPVAYLVGSVPFGLIVGLSRGVDPRRAGSGNIGATNVGRLLGGKFFAIVFTLDLLKGLLPMLAAMAVQRLVASGNAAAPPAGPSAADYALWLAVGFAAIVGHMFSLFLQVQRRQGRCHQHRRPAGRLPLLHPAGGRRPGCICRHI